jgi:hypothetical protein
MTYRQTVSVALLTLLALLINYAAAGPGFLTWGLLVALALDLLAMSYAIIMDVLSTR